MLTEYCSGPADFQFCFSLRNARIPCQTGVPGGISPNCVIHSRRSSQEIPMRNLPRFVLVLRTAVWSAAAPALTTASPFSHFPPSTRSHLPTHPPPPPPPP